MVDADSKEDAKKRKKSPAQVRHGKKHTDKGKDKAGSPKHAKKGKDQKKVKGHHDSHENFF